VYAQGNPARRSLTWVDYDGKAEPLGTEQGRYLWLALAPDGSRALVGQVPDIWIYDLQRPGTRTRLTLQALKSEGTINLEGNNFYPMWSRDGKRVYFASNRGGDWDIYSQPADGSQPAEVLLKRPYDQFPSSVAPDGTLLFAELHPTTGLDIWALAPDGKVTPVRVTPFNEADPIFSPDGRWIAYDSNESGRSEIYVQNYPGGGKRLPVSTGGGTMPRWSRDGKELFYIAGDAMMMVAVPPDGFPASAPRKLFDCSSYLRDSYDVSPDGKHFLMIRRDPVSTPHQLNVILNWSDELDRLVPIGKK
jgi:Tol biopolymer transport system component